MLEFILPNLSSTIYTNVFSFEHTQSVLEISPSYVWVKRC